MALWRTAVVYGHVIRFSHSLFALPFALSAALLAATLEGVSLRQLGWIAVAMVAARSAAMGFNRLADRHLDAANPRTCNRELPRGAMSPLAVGVFVALSAVVLVWAAYQLNPLCLYLSPLALAILFFYSLTKRFTWASHLVLGLSLGEGPVGAWIGVTGRVDLPPILLGVAVLAWVAGFDVLYACQDYEFDRGAGLHSIPVRFGLPRALLAARLLHGAAVLLLAGLGLLMGLKLLYLVGLVAIVALLIYEHSLVRADDLSRLDTAFFTMNGVISIVYLVSILADLLLLGDAARLVRL